MAAHRTPDRARAVDRLEKDVAMYQGEIEELQDRIRDEAEESQARHLNRLLLETRRALAKVLMEIDGYRE